MSRIPPFRYLVTAAAVAAAAFLIAQTGLLPANAAAHSAPAIGQAVAAATPSQHDTTTPATP